MTGTWDSGLVSRFDRVRSSRLAVFVITDRGRLAQTAGRSVLSDDVVGGGQLVESLPTTHPCTLETLSVSLRKPISRNRKFIVSLDAHTELPSVPNVGGARLYTIVLSSLVRGMKSRTVGPRGPACPAVFQAGLTHSFTGYLWTQGLSPLPRIAGFPIQFVGHTFKRTTK